MKNTIPCKNADSKEVLFPEESLRYTCCAECPCSGDYDERDHTIYCGKFGHRYSSSDGCSQGPNG